MGILRTIVLGSGAHYWHMISRGGVILQDVFGGERNAIADALNLNAGVALYAAGITTSPQEGVSRAQEAQRRGDLDIIHWIIIIQ